MNILSEPGSRSLHTLAGRRISDWPSNYFQRDIRIRTAEIRAAHGVRRGEDGQRQTGRPGEGALAAQGSIQSSSQGCLADKSVSVELDTLDQTMYPTHAHLDESNSGEAGRSVQTMINSLVEPDWQ